MKLSIVVPSYNDAVGLWFTHAAAMADVEKDFAKEDVEFIAVIDGSENDTVVGFEQQKTCKVIKGDFGGPQCARHAGALASRGRYIAFLDSHVVPSRGMFASLVDAAERSGGWLVHAPHTFWNSNLRCYAYKMDFHHRFWCCQVHNEPQHPEPYRIGVMGHGVILVDREKYMETGGYGTLQKGWGGEEPYLNLKFWMLGGSCWVDPRCYHWHYMTKRRTEEVYRQKDYVRNFMLAAYVIGGRRYLDGIYTLHTLAANGCKSVAEAAAAPPIDIFRESYETVPTDAAEERARVIAGPFGGNCDALRGFFSNTARSNLGDKARCES